MGQSMKYEKYKPEGVKKKIWEIVVEAWENGLSDKEACFRVLKLTGDELTPAKMRSWYVKNAKVQELRDMLRDQIITSARLVIKESIEKDKNEKTARWVLEHKAADEFSTKAAIAFERAAIEISVADKEENMKKFMEQFGEE